MAFRVSLRALHERTPTASEDVALRRVAEELRPFDAHVARVAVRLEPAVRGRKSDARCVLEIATSDGDPIVAEEHARGAVEAIERATAAAAQMLEARFGAPKRQTRQARGARRPEPRARDVVPPTTTATRNTKVHTSGLAYALEGSATGKASRKSTRKSANRSKPDSNLRRRETRRARAPRTRAMNGKARGERATK